MFSKLEYDFNSLDAKKKKKDPWLNLMVGISNTVGRKFIRLINLNKICRDRLFSEFTGNIKCSFSASVWHILQGWNLLSAHPYKYSVLRFVHFNTVFAQKQAIIYRIHHTLYLSVNLKSM